jgi:hypothetical protein
VWKIRIHIIISENGAGMATVDNGCERKIVKRSTEAVSEKATFDFEGKSYGRTVLLKTLDAVSKKMKKKVRAKTRQYFPADLPSREQSAKRVSILPLCAPDCRENDQL